MLDHLEKYHGISAKIIYNDLHGYIRIQNLHQSGYTEFFKGLTCQERGDQETTSEAKRKEYEKSIEHYTQSIQLNPNHAPTYQNRGIAYAEIGDYKHAIEDFNKTIDLDPDVADGYHNRGRTYGTKGEYKSAIENFNKALELNSDFAVTYYDRGAIGLRLKEWEKAKSDLTTAKEKGINTVNEFRNDYESIEAFEERYGIQLPADIVEMLTPGQS